MCRLFIVRLSWTERDNSIDSGSTLTRFLSKAYTDFLLKFYCRMSESWNITTAQKHALLKVQIIRLLRNISALTLRQHYAAWLYVKPWYWVQHHLRFSVSPVNVFGLGGRVRGLHVERMYTRLLNERRKCEYIVIDRSTRRTETPRAATQDTILSIVQYSCCCHLVGHVSPKEATSFSDRRTWAYDHDQNRVSLCLLCLVV